MSTKPKSRLFEYINALSYTKDTSILDDPNFEKEYVPFVANRAFSYHKDSVLVANAMNERAHLSKPLQGAFILNSLRPRKRFSAWIKHKVSEDARIVAEYYGCSLRHATTLVALHTPDQLTQMRQRLTKGGHA